MYNVKMMHKRGEVVMVRCLRLALWRRDLRRRNWTCQHGGIRSLHSWPQTRAAGGRVRDFNQRNSEMCRSWRRRSRGRRGSSMERREGGRLARVLGKSSAIFLGLEKTCKLLIRHGARRRRNRRGRLGHWMWCLKHRSAGRHRALAP